MDPSICMVFAYHIYNGLHQGPMNGKYHRRKSSLFINGLTTNYRRSIVGKGPGTWEEHSDIDSTKIVLG